MEKGENEKMEEADDNHQFSISPNLVNQVSRHRVRGVHHVFHSAPAVVQVAIVQVLPLDAAVDVADVVSRKEGEDSVAHLVIGTRSIHSRVSSAQRRELAVHLQLVTRFDHNRVVVPVDTVKKKKHERK